MLSEHDKNVIREIICDRMKMEDKRARLGKRLLNGAGRERAQLTLDINAISNKILAFKFERPVSEIDELEMEVREKRAYG